MKRFADARVPLRFAPAADAMPDEAIFTIEEVGHTPGCACCAGTSQAARALLLLLQDRARGRVPFFRGVLADVSPVTRAALEADALVSTCFLKS